MEKLKFSKTIKGAPKVVWHALWDDKNYREWTSAFSPGSYAESDWKQGSEIRFLSPKGEGIYAIIDKKEEPLYMAFKHQGEIKDGKKLPPGAWQGAMETYTLSEKGSETELVVELDTLEEYKEHFQTAWVKALDKLKEVAEREAK